MLPHLKQLLRVGFVLSFDASFPAFWDGERARPSRRPASRIFFPELAVSQPGKCAHQKTYPGKGFLVGFSPCRLPEYLHEKFYIIIQDIQCYVFKYATL